MSRPTAQIAVITPTTLDPARLGYLTELHDSLERQTVPFEWILAPNGPDAELRRLPPQIAADPRVTICARPRPGAAYARNTALNYVTAPYTCYVDDDDLLPEGSLATRHEHAVRTGLDWVAGWSADLHADGTTRTWVCPTPVGRHTPGQVWTYWNSPETKPPLGHTMLLTRTELLRLSAGHGGLVKGEDYVLVLGVTGRGAGELLPEVVYLYRDHAHQMTEQTDYRDASEYDARRFAFLHGQELHRAAQRQLLAGSATP
ncbi:glycosyltransferase family 2 protein [Streptomyces griseofuscus]|uniref:glycosyltransferase family 2 protein n=1 Tax=Streptomyces griseofuscus TaxID=146922 RepID=UPI0036B8BFD8